ncbi:hypothetical protein QBC41DRAFT_319700 [Cercophora samala]|uniref:Secreted protein n=1 Tax=Cercophora samala TaxID=330535 RepID=A0AA39ZES5_9PEZI|nr:hypothetical protein QBC41DRAFT_319700 [Cercophora samala]
MRTNNVSFAYILLSFLLRRFFCLESLPFLWGAGGCIRRKAYLPNGCCLSLLGPPLLRVNVNVIFCMDGCVNLPNQ